MQTQSQGPVSELRSAHSSRTSRVLPARLCSGSAAVCCSAVHANTASTSIARQNTYAARTSSDRHAEPSPLTAGLGHITPLQLRHQEEGPGFHAG